MNSKTTSIMPLLVLALLAPVGVTNAVAQEAPGGIEDDTQKTTAYEKSDILQMFNVMERHILIDSDYHFDIDITSSQNDPYVSELDIQIAQRYASYNDRVMDVVGPVGQVNESQTGTDQRIGDIISDFRSGEFRKLFDDDNDGPVGTTLSATPSILSDKIVPVHHGAWPTWCGGNFLDPHLSDPNPSTHYGGDSLSSTQQILEDRGFHMVPEYAAWNGAASQPYEFTKVVASSNYGGLCDTGAFRDHAGINGDFSYTVQDEEPNPEILSYVWPSPYWGLYVPWWHEYY